MSATTPKAAVFVPAGPPAAQPMPGLSKRAQAMLDPRRNGHFRNTGTDQRDSGIKAQGKKKAAI